MEIEFNVWLYSLLVSAAISSVVSYVLPEGRNRSIIEFGCSCLMIVMLVAPFKSIDFSILASEFSEFNTKIQVQIDDEEENAEAIYKDLIKQEYKEYILNEAKRNDIHLVDVDVTFAKESKGNYIPECIIYKAEDDFTSEFVLQIEKALGVPMEREIDYEH